MDLDSVSLEISVFTNLDSVITCTTKYNTSIVTF